MCISGGYMMLGQKSQRQTMIIVSHMLCVEGHLVVQWLRICLPMQGTRVRARVREDPTCRRATKPVRHNY